MNENEKHQQVQEMMYLYKQIPDINDMLKPILKKDCLNILCYMHLGDDFFRTSFNQDIIDKYKHQVHWIIQPNEKILMPIWGITNYTVFDIYKTIKPLKKYFKKSYIFEYFCMQCVEKQVTSSLTVGKLAIIFMHNNSFQENIEKYGKDRTLVEFLTA